MSSNFKYTAGLSNVGSYQVSGVPYMTASTTLLTAWSIKVEFPYVTSWVKIDNTSISDKTLVVAIAGYHATASGNAGTKHNISLLPTSSTGILPWKLSELYVSGANGACDFNVYAGLTNIPTERVDNIAPTGTNWSGSAGVG